MRASVRNLLIALSLGVLGIAGVGCEPEPAPPDVTPASCAAVTCLVGSDCVEIDGRATCVSRDPCVGKSCPAGQHCEAPADAPMCVPDAPTCICTREYRPVCGVDGKTYGNRCMARCAQVAIAYEGECRGGPGRR